jgi:hypothetical protein
MIKILGCKRSTALYIGRELSPKRGPIGASDMTDAEHCGWDDR